MLVSVAASAQTNPLVDERIPIQPILLPDIPSVELVVPGSHVSVEKSASPPDETAAAEGVLVEGRTGILYQRKKEGEQALALRSEQSVLVKVIDMDTRRLECLLWLAGGDSIRLPGLPSSRYRVLFCQGIRQENDRLIPGWFGAVDGQIDLIRARGRVSIDLSIHSSTHRILPSSREEWNRFNPPR